MLFNTFVIPLRKPRRVNNLLYNRCFEKAATLALLGRPMLNIVIRYTKRAPQEATEP